jgi:hypothetical protein
MAPRSVPRHSGGTSGNRDRASGTRAAAARSGARSGARFGRAVGRAGGPGGRSAALPGVLAAQHSAANPPASPSCFVARQTHRPESLLPQYPVLPRNLTGSRRHFHPPFIAAQPDPAPADDSALPVPCHATPPFHKPPPDTVAPRRAPGRTAPHTVAPRRTPSHRAARQSHRAASHASLARARSRSTGGLPTHCPFCEHPGARYSSRCGPYLPTVLKNP